MVIEKLALALFLASLAGDPVTVSAQEKIRNEPYSLESLDGDFALVGTYTGGTAARQLGVFHFKDGTATGVLRVNVQGATPTQRIVVSLSTVGTATIADDGTGVATLTVTYPDGSLHQATLDLLITRATEGRRMKIATELATMQRETPALSPGSFIVGTLTRRPE